MTGETGGVKSLRSRSRNIYSRDRTNFETENKILKIMTLATLTNEEKEIVRRAMQASLIYIDAEFSARMGLEESHMARLLEAWPEIDDSRAGSAVYLAVNNALNDLLYGVGISNEQALQAVGADRAEMRRVYKKWAAGHGRSSTGVC